MGPMGIFLHKGDYKGPNRFAMKPNCILVLINFKIAFGEGCFLISVTPGLKKNSDEQLGRLGSGHPSDFFQTGEYRPAADGMEIVSSISQFL